MTASQFAFATCHPGLEAALLQELAATRPHLRRAFSRPGFVTLKDPDGPIDPGAALGARLARASGVAWGPLPQAATAQAAVRALAATAGRLHLHAWGCQDDLQVPAATLDALRGGASGAWREDPTLRSGDPVLDVMAVDAETVWWGWHRHQATQAPHPGGALAVQVPEAAPSRAYGKMVEQLAWSGADVQAGHTVLELGCAPGGGTYALLERGVHVIGVDPGAMADSVRTLARQQQCRLWHIRHPVAQLRTAGLPPVDWLFSDMNLAPSVVLRAVRRLVAALRPQLRGVLMTWKLNDAKVVAQLPQLLQSLAALGCHSVRAAHLGQHRRELAVWGALPAPSGPGA